ncbi:transcriptional regulator [Sediminibacillus dalangtanensis]|uniref:Transcriptional regulator n=1 Tax=Sediminibacillus dalangtanensis TaxID=2729421 RepID=A0ABX7VUS5_9BACI|nr:Rrf2 family transcriptional regulator [Sediminibacillus dalangtanensis]QTM99759.1 transcriptional regulator [Sediminibacillus dalangtanensis]
MNSEFTLAVHSLTYLALHPGQMATSNAIAESTAVHPVRVRKVLGLLRKQGYIATKEGCAGGFILRVNPEEIGLHEIYKITSEGTLIPKCSPANPDCVVGANMKSTLTTIFGNAEKQLESFLAGYSINDVAMLVRNHPSKPISEIVTDL